MRNMQRKAWWPTLFTFALLTASIERYGFAQNINDDANVGQGELVPPAETSLHDGEPSAGVTVNERNFQGGTPICKRLTSGSAGRY
jgi:hypothetical protein